MNTRNFQIGDWVIYEDKHTKYLPQQIAEVHQLGEVQFTNGVTVAKEYIVPIPLTEEILELNNITDYEYYDGYHLTVKNEKIGCEINKVVLFVHELQQMLRLCEYNTWANNFKIEK